MRFSNLSYLLVSATLAATPALAHAETAPVTQSVPAERAVQAPAAQAKPSDDATRYAAREQQDQKARQFQGGAAEVVVIGTGTITLALLIVLLVVLI
ncbi:MAG: hypothetical protein KF773_39910 [Deltaproteobacteria bacterium]|nr:hypothetical protein [Deltaproteobacteria bacterium]